jgi:glycosyltransferase involved in cell wall biosynthesis
VLAERHAVLPEGIDLLTMPLRAPQRIRALEHDVVRAKVLRQSRADVFHSPAQHPPRKASIPWVQTLHDLTPLTWRHPELARDRRRWLRVGKRLHTAAAIVACSRFSADEGIRHFGLDPRRIEVISLGVDHSVFRPEGFVAARGPYMLHVAAYGPHKGYREALSVFARLVEMGAPHRLILAGPQDDWMLAQISALVDSSARPDRVEIAGFIDDIASIYRGAAALLMTSRCEGFGLPAIEAMACGTPVLAFRNSSLPEVVGEAGVLVADGDISAMTAAAKRLLNDRHHREELIQRGLARARHFTWDNTVDAYAEVFDSVAK